MTTPDDEARQLAEIRERDASYVNDIGLETAPHTVRDRHFLLALVDKLRADAEIGAKVRHEIEECDKRFATARARLAKCRAAIMRMEYDQYDECPMCMSQPEEGHALSCAMKAALDAATQDEETGT